MAINLKRTIPRELPTMETMRALIVFLVLLADTAWGMPTDIDDRKWLSRRLISHILNHFILNEGSDRPGPCLNTKNVFPGMGFPL